MEEKLEAFFNGKLWNELRTHKAGIKVAYDILKEMTGHDRHFLLDEHLAVLYDPEKTISDVPIGDLTDIIYSLISINSDDDFLYLTDGNLGGVKSGKFFISLNTACTSMDFIDGILSSFKDDIEQLTDEDEQRLMLLSEVNDFEAIRDKGIERIDTELYEFNVFLRGMVIDGFLDYQESDRMFENFKVMIKKYSDDFEHQIDAAVDMLHIISKLDFDEQSVQ